MHLHSWFMDSPTRSAWSMEQVSAAVVSGGSMGAISDKGREVDGWRGERQKIDSSGKRRVTSASLFWPNM